jgi:hypothetical protein
VSARAQNVPGTIFLFAKMCFLPRKVHLAGVPPNPRKWGATQMPIESALFVAGVVAAFGIFILVLAWASRKSG